MSAAVAQIRDIGIVAHINAGKTTLSERILFDCGRVRTLGEVDAGTATLDFLPEEQRRGISIRAASTSVRWREWLLHLIDTPGHVDFGAETTRALRVLDGAVVVLDGVRGVESQTEAVWRQTRALGLPALVFVNKLDRPVADWLRVLGSLRDRLGVRVLPAVVPILGEQGLAGLVDVVSGARRQWSDGTPLLDPVRAREQLVEAAADFAPAVMEDFLHDAPVDDDRLRGALRAGVLRAELTLAFAGSALHNQGVDALLDGVGQFLPSPLDRSPVRGVDGSERVATSAAPACALVFRSFVEAGEHLLAVRVYSGRIAPGTVLGRSDGGQMMVRAVARPHADDREPAAVAGPGDIVVLSGAEGHVPTGVTLFSPGHPIALAPAPFAVPVLSAAIEPRHAEDLPAVAAAAQRLVLGDPTLALRQDDARGVLLLSGIGELHLETAAEQLRADVGDRFRMGKPEVACRETVRRAAEGSGEWRVAEIAARAAVRLRLAPAPQHGPATVVLAADLAGNAVAERLAQSLTARLRGNLREGWPAFDLEVRIDAIAGGAAEGQDPLPVFVEAAEVALRRALADADPAVMQPVVRLEVTCPHDALSPVLGDLRGKQVDIAAIDVDGEQARVRGTAPFARLLGYTTRLRSLTRGLGSFHLEPAGYSPVLAGPVA